VAGDDLSGAWNFRDVAEQTGIRPGRFYRSSELSRLDDDGREAMLRLGITDVADLRSLREVERRGSGRVPDGVEVHLLPFHELSNQSPEGAAAPHEYAFERMMTEKPDDEDAAIAAGRFMTEEYRRFPALAGAHLAVRQVISMLADERPVITHCFAGKDRTGFTVAVVLEAAGVPRDAILATSCGATRRCRDYATASSSRSAIGPVRARRTKSSHSPKRGSPTRCWACARTTCPRRGRPSTRNTERFRITSTRLV